MPIIDARLEDGSRVAICVAPATPYTAITIRRFGGRRFTTDDLVELGSLTLGQVELIRRTLLGRKNVLVSGGTGSGKTTLLNALIELLPLDDRIVAIEDTLELSIRHQNCVRFEARELGEGSVTIRDLVKHALRHRPDHIVVGEVRGAEAADLLQALNTGHGGSLTTIHANNAVSALSRLASCAMQAGGLPWEVLCRSVVDGISLVVHTSRIAGRRAVEEVRILHDWRGRGQLVEDHRLQGGRPLSGVIAIHRLAGGRAFMSTPHRGERDENSTHRRNGRPPAEDGTRAAGGAQQRPTLPTFRGPRDTVRAARGPTPGRRGRRRRPRSRGGPRMTASDNRPVAEVRLGAVKAAIWENDTEGGDVYHSVTFERLYRTDDGDWRSTASFRGGELLLLAKVARCRARPRPRTPQRVPGRGLRLSRLIRGERDVDGTARVYIGDELLAPGSPLWHTSLCLRNHSPTGPNWGYHGSGPAQLAIVILLVRHRHRGGPALLPPSSGAAS